MNRDLVLAEWRRAQQALRAGELLTAEDCYADAVTRTYYAVFHAAKAALHARGIAAETHPSVRSMFGLHLIKTGEIEKDYAVHLAARFRSPCRLRSRHFARSAAGRGSRRPCEYSGRHDSRLRHRTG